MINYFNKLTEDQDNRRMYSKGKSVEVFNKLKEGGNNPYPSNFNPVQTPPPTFQPQTQFPMYSQFQSPNGAQNGHNQYGKKKRIDPEKIMAQTTAIN